MGQQSSGGCSVGRGAAAIGACAQKHVHCSRHSWEEGSGPHRKGGPRLLVVQNAPPTLPRALMRLFRADCWRRLSLASVLSSLRTEVLLAIGSIKDLHLQKLLEAMWLRLVSRHDTQS